jgi:hypothetical protein
MVLAAVVCDQQQMVKAAPDERVAHGICVGAPDLQLVGGGPGQARKPRLERVGGAQPGEVLRLPGPGQPESQRGEERITLLRGGRVRVDVRSREHGGDGLVGHGVVRRFHERVENTWFDLRHRSLTSVVASIGTAADRAHGFSPVRCCSVPEAPSLSRTA